MQDYYRRNKDWILARNNKYKEENKEIIREHRHLAYLANRERVLAKCKKNYELRKKMTWYKYPHLDEMREKIPTAWGKYDFDRQRSQRRSGMKEHLERRYQNHLKKRQNKKEERVQQKIQKRKEEKDSK